MATILRPATVARIAPRPTPPGYQSTFGANLLLGTLAGQDTFFAEPGRAPVYDWPPVRARPPNPGGFLSSVNLNLLGQDKFFASPGIGPDYDWPPSRRRPASDQQFGPGPNLNLLQPVVLPFSQPNWPAPLARPSSVQREFSSFSFALQQPVQVIPFNIFDWPRAQVRPPNPGGFINQVNLNLIGQDVFFYGAGRAPTYEWPPPRARPPNAGGFLAPVNLNLMGQDKFFRGPGQAPVYDWPPPRGRTVRHDRFTIGLNLLQSTLTPSSAPFAMTYWPPAQPRRAPMAFMHVNWTATFGQITRVRVQSFFVG